MSTIELLNPSITVEDFCRKYIDFFEHYFEKEPVEAFKIFNDLKFPKECELLGFEMDCGESFTNAFGEQAWLYPDGLEEQIVHTTDVKLIGASIFSKWRFFNHWSDSGPTEKDIEWFLIVFRHLQKLAKEQSL